jgi:hypothetical protein
MAPNVLSGNNRHIGLDDSPHRLPLDVNPRHPCVPDGKRRRVILRKLVEDVVISPWAQPDEIEEIQLWTKLKTSTATRDSELRDKATPSLVEFRKFKGIVEPAREKERVVPKEELERYYVDCTPKMRHEVKGRPTLNGEVYGCGPENLQPRSEDRGDAGN